MDTLEPRSPSAQRRTKPPRVNALLGRCWPVEAALALSTLALVASCNLDFEKQSIEPADDTTSQPADAYDGLDGDSTADTTRDGDATPTTTTVSDLASDVEDCGCSPGSACCDGATCVSLLTSADHCGACGVTCDFELCIEGACCVPDTTCESRDCGRVASDGCGRTLDCGTCADGDQCSADGLCVPIDVWEPRIPDTATRLCLLSGDTSPLCPEPGEPSYGQDGNYTIFPPAYRVVGDVVTDEVTGLTWMQTPLPGDFVDDQIAACAASTHGELDGWRLPTFLELYTLVDHGKNKDTYDIGAFENLGEGRVITTTATMNGNVASIAFNDGRTTSEPGGRALCVRGTALPTARIAAEDTVQVPGLGLEFTRAAEAPAVWRQALQHCEALTLNGSSDWRLPNAKELALVYDDASVPAEFWPELEFTGDIDDDPALWSSTPDGRLEGDVRVFRSPPDTSPLDRRDQMGWLCVRNL